MHDQVNAARPSRIEQSTASTLRALGFCSDSGVYSVDPEFSLAEVREALFAGSYWPPPVLRFSVAEAHDSEQQSELCVVVEAVRVVHRQIYGRASRRVDYLDEPDYLVSGVIADRPSSQGTAVREVRLFLDHVGGGELEGAYLQFESPTNGGDLDGNRCVWPEN